MEQRILVLGGAGDMGRGVVADLVSQGQAPVVGDVDKSRLGEVRDEFGVETCVIDVTDDAAVDVLTDYDVVIGAIGPFYRFGERMIELAIEAGVDYVDLCDDHDAIVAQLAYDEQAVEADVTAVVGCGWTPGISNMLALYGAEELDGAERIDIDWVGSAADSDGLAVINHVFHVLDGEVVQFIDGEHRAVEAGSMGHVVEFPDLGRQRTAACGHPEPITLPEQLSAETVTLRGALIPQYQNRLVDIFNRVGLTATDPRRDKLARLIHAVEGVLSIGGVGQSAVHVTVTNGNARRTYAAVGPMATLTGSTAAVGASLLLENDTPSGVVPPEGVFDASELLNRLRNRSIEFYESANQQPVTEFTT